MVDNIAFSLAARYTAAQMRETDPSLTWHRPYGWRADSRYVEPGASAAAVITHEQDELGNDLGVPPFLLEALHQIPAQDIVWVCRTRDHARRYGGEGRGQPYKEDVGEGALILATDHEAPETGYLLLKDATRLDPEVKERFLAYRRERHEVPIFERANRRRE